ncbi:protein SPA1-RELATED 4-like isoform X1 [Zingiber officinale]|uniref:protein SPA1-RELATED 4-like isoform X1 n=1 Tax=Zingiber officinale TaxID=94328 RepID=UPI001C4D3C67|nr:protein SPA1-RELATED 4-like isoform X1 [Zingiber officinale]
MFHGMPSGRQVFAIKGGLREERGERNRAKGGEKEKGKGEGAEAKGPNQRWDFAALFASAASGNPDPPFAWWFSFANARFVLVSEVASGEREQGAGLPFLLGFDLIGRDLVEEVERHGAKKMDGSEETSGRARSSSASRAAGGAGFSGSIDFSRGPNGCIWGWDQEEEEEKKKEDFVREEEKEELRRLLSFGIGGNGAGGGGGDVSLREWLDRAGRAVELLECLHVFRQVLEAAHKQGVVVGNVRPSCFVISPSNRVSFIESASFSTSGLGGSSSSAQGEGTEAFPEGPSSLLRDADGNAEKTTFPTKPILLMESSWYTSPEEADGAPATYASDVFRLGVLLFELFCAFDSLEDKLTAMADLRHRILPRQLLLNWPKEASFCLWLLHPQPDTRPKMSEVLRSEFLNRQINFLEEGESVSKISEEIEDQELLREFLLHLQYQKLDVAHRLHDAIACISSDIQEIQDQRSILTQNSFLKLNRDGHSSSLFTKIDQPARKRCRPDYKNELNNLGSEDPESVTELQIHQQNIAVKSSRLMKNFKKLEAAYFSARCRKSKSTHRPPNKPVPVSRCGTGSAVWTKQSSIDDTVLKGHGGREGKWVVSSFLEDLCKYLSFSKLKVRVNLKQGDLLNTMNLVCSMGFDRDKEFFATAGVNKKIKVFECDMILNKDRDIHYPIVEMINKSKLSCICWNSYIKSQIASSDFEGVVKVWDVTRSQSLAEMKEHERRVWSVDFSLTDPTKFVSGSDDGTVKLWSINKAGSTGSIRTKANVCSVQFHPDSAYSLAVGSANHRVYCYDLRNLRMPFCTLPGHTKTVSYVRYLDASHLVSASTDNTLTLWNLPTCTTSAADNILQTFSGHTNNQNFVGLSVYDGYIATGSETNEVFVYHKSFPMPILSYKFGSADQISSQSNNDATQFVSCVCWQGQSTMLLAANSSGSIKFLEMV